MGKQANIQNVELLDSFRADIREFQQVALRELDSMHKEVRRMEAWITLEQPPIWKIRSRKVESEVNNARSDLERAKISRPDESPRMFADQRKALNRAKAKQQMTMDRIRDLKKWGSVISKESMLMQSGLRSLSNSAGDEMSKLASMLKILADHLDSYLRLSPNPGEFEQWASDRQDEADHFGRSGKTIDDESGTDSLNDTDETGEMDGQP